VKKTIQKNTIYCGDNLAVLKGFEDNCVDLFYGDPQFFSNKKYETFWGDAQEIRMFEDVWVKQGDGRYSKDINTYLNFMEPRLREIHRVLKDAGSFYLHCDWHADAYLRVLCDQIFDRKPSCVIYWMRTSSPKTSCKYYAINTDTILFYTKSDNATFKKEFGEVDESLFTKTETETGRKYYTHGMAVKGNSPKTLNVNGRSITAPDGMRFRWNQDTLNKELVKNPLVIEWSDTGKLYSKSYMDESKGNPTSNIWDDIPNIRQNCKEHFGYPTQKPEALLERIIKASSNEGDVVLDAWAGCGATLAVAKRLNRQYVGIDISPTACRLVANRIGYPLAEIIGMAFTADEIAALTGYEFQNAVIRLLDPTLNTIKVNKKGPDGGIDGSYYDTLISVKKYKAGRKDLDEFFASISRNKKKEGIFIALDFSSDFIKEIARLEREDKIKIYPFTVADLVGGKHKNVMENENTRHGKLI